LIYLSTLKQINRIPRRRVGLLWDIKSAALLFARSLTERLVVEVCARSRAGWLSVVNVSIATKRERSVNEFHNEITIQGDIQYARNGRKIDKKMDSIT